MGVYFHTQDGRKGMLDVAMMLREEGLLPYGVEHGNVKFTSEDGSEGMFSIADWAVKNGFQIDKIDGFNTPVTAIDVPPQGMTNLDQSVFFMGGKKVEALKGVFSQVTELEDGRVVVLDKDGLWKTMWSDTWSPPQPFPKYDEMVGRGLALDTKQGMRSAGLSFLLGLSGTKPKIDSRNELEPKCVAEAMHRIKRNAPIENQMLIGKLVEQTIGVTQWEFMAGLESPEEVESWVEQFLKKSTFDIRFQQSQMAELLMAGLHKIALDEFSTQINALKGVDKTKGLVVNLKEPVDEFISMMDSLDVIRDMSRVTGLDEWKARAETEVDQTKLPPMPAFVPRLVALLNWIMPISKEKALSIARGKKGLGAVFSLMYMIDKALFSLSEVPDTSAKQKMFMALKTLQTKIEGKLAFYYHPSDDKTGTQTNLFHEAKANYGDKRETVYKMIQSPKDKWSQMLLEKVQQEPNLAAFYGVLPDWYARLMKSFVSMNVAYNLQPCVDGNYEARLADPFARTQPQTGSPPPKSGYLGDQSPRAALNIIEALTSAARMLLDMGEAERHALLRTPSLMSNLIKSVQTASVNREVGATEVLNKLGVNGKQDPYKTLDPKRIWDNPEDVAKDQAAQMMQLMAQLQAQQQQAAADQQAQSMQLQSMAAPPPGADTAGMPSGPAAQDAAMAAG